jgi:hypothetical protein
MDAILETQPLICRISMVFLTGPANVTVDYVRVCQVLPHEEYLSRERYGFRDDLYLSGKVGRVDSRKCQVSPREMNGLPGLVLRSFPRRRLFEIVDY